ncbi:MAG TPA: hypothetical protein VGC17_07475 [Lactovum miscens]|uniref:hypothetical protein n=1 Tax=Lactovum miscens TaxID=190387 RepID=UPI002ED9D6E6
MLFKQVFILKLGPITLKWKDFGGDKERVAFVGTGYVGLNLIAQCHEVVALNIISEKVASINSKWSPIVGKEIEELLASKDLNLLATTYTEMALKGSEFVLVVTPTNYDDLANCNYKLASFNIWLELL